MRKLNLLAWLLAVAWMSFAWSVPAAAAEDEARVFAPSTDWALGSDGESCWIVRQFGSREDGVILRLQAFSPGRIYMAVLWGKPLPQRDSGLLEFEYRFEPDSHSIGRSGVLSRSSGAPMLIFSTSLESADQEAARLEAEGGAPIQEDERLATINAFTVTFSRGRPLTLQLGSIADAITRLHACANDLPRKWGLDPTVEQSLSRRARAIDQASWIAPGTYPWEYLRTSESLIVHLRVMVDAAGAATGCVVQGVRDQSGSEQLACREIMRTARFEPALDAAGNPVPSYFATTVFYFTPRRNGND